MVQLEKPPQPKFLLDLDGEGDEKEQTEKPNEKEEEKPTESTPAPGIELFFENNFQETFFFFFGSDNSVTKLLRLRKLHLLRNPLLHHRKLQR